jgi:hypothetical protein
MKRCPKVSTLFRGIEKHAGLGDGWLIVIPEEREALLNHCGSASTWCSSSDLQV